MISELWVDDLQIMSPTGALPNYHVNKFKGLGMPAVRSNRPVRGRRHGSFELTTFYEPREFQFDVWIFGNNVGGSLDWASFWTAHQAFVDNVDLKSLQRSIQFRRVGDPYGGMEFAYVTPDGAMEPRFPHAGTAACVYEDVTLIAADPRLYFVAGGSVTSIGAFSVFNAGNFNSPPLITLTGVGSAILTNNSLTTENKLYIKNAGGGTVYVDVRNRTVYLNGVAAPQIVDADKSFFWALTPGVNNISVSGASSATFEWNDARIS